MKLIEQILAKNNVREALNRIVSNKGASGIDGMKVEELRDYMNANWTSIKQSILERRYKPAPVRRVEIPKPNGGVRKLGIPTVVAHLRGRVSREQLRLPPRQELRASRAEAFGIPQRGSGVDS